MANSYSCVLQAIYVGRTSVRLHTLRIELVRYTSQAHTTPTSIYTNGIHTLNPKLVVLLEAEAVESTLTVPKSSHLREGLAKWGCSSRKVTVYTRLGGNTNRTLLTQLQPQGHT